MPSNEIITLALLGVLFFSIVVFVSLTGVALGYIAGCKMSSKRTGSHPSPSFNIQETGPDIEDDSPYRDEIERLKKSMEARGVQ
jgi:hypothetical protein